MFFRKIFRFLVRQFTKIEEFFFEKLIDPIEAIMNNFEIGLYHFMKLLGRGSFGEVYLVSKQGELYACKVIETTDLEDNQRKSLDREVFSLLYLIFCRWKLIDHFIVAM